MGNPGLALFVISISWQSSYNGYNRTAPPFQPILGFVQNNQRHFNYCSNEGFVHQLASTEPDNYPPINVDKKAFRQEKKFMTINKIKYFETDDCFYKKYRSEQLNRLFVQPPLVTCITAWRPQ